LLNAAPLTPGRTLESLVERVRILCTVYDPETGAYRYDYKLILEIIGGLAFFLSVLAHLLLDRWRHRRGTRFHVASP
jgi:protein SCO1/2